MISEVFGSTDGAENRPRGDYPIEPALLWCWSQGPRISGRFTKVSGEGFGDGGASRGAHSKNANPRGRDSAANAAEFF